MMVGEPTGTSSVLVTDTEGRLTLVKLSDRSDYGFNLGLIGPTDVKYEIESTTELSGIVAKRISSKKEKLAKKGVLKDCPDVILALYDAYGFCSPTQAREALSSVQGYDWLHSIFWTASFNDTQNLRFPDNPGRVGEFLATKEEAWNP
jgi:hypothetical protein